MKSFIFSFVVIASFVLGSCSSSRQGGAPPPPATFTIGGTVSGLSGTGLVLQDNGGDSLAVSANGPFTFATALASGSAYSVTVSAQPSSPAQTCAVTNGSGTAVANVTNVQVACTTTATFTIGGAVSGLSGTGLMLQDNGGDSLAVSANGPFTFATALASGSAYSVTVSALPSSPAQTCAVTNGSGTVSANVTNVQVACTTTPTFTIGGMVSGLSGTGLVLQDNGDDNLTVSANGSFVFAKAVASGGTYNVTVHTQPSNPVQTCAVTNGTGTVTANVTNVAVTCGAFAPAFTTLHSFANTDGRNPFAGLVLATNGELYGTTQAGNHDGNDFTGTIFDITTGGTLTTLYNFCSGSNCADGQGPFAGLIQGANGDFFGTTAFGGRNVSCAGGTGCGTVFELTPGGTLTTLYTFCPQSPCTDGTTPHAALVQGTDGNFYGTTESGGGMSVGTIFKITPSGTLTTLHSFAGAEGANPFAALIQGTNGNFYGTTSSGGANNNDGAIFEITPSGTLTILHSFDGTDGAHPEAGLIQGTDGNFYGTTPNGGAQQGGCAAEVRCGTVFRITPNGAFTSLYSFCSESGCPDGQVPNAALVQGSDGNFYGTTQMGGHDGTCPKVGACGTIFKITPSGELTTLYNFCSEGGSACTDGSNPDAFLIQDPANGTFYGTTNFSGANGNNGTVFSLSVGLGPFTETRPTSGGLGATVKIVGTDLTGAVRVTFSGIAASFTVVSGSEITATVPPGAATGTVQVVTPSGTLSSRIPFVVQP